MAGDPGRLELVDLERAVRARSPELGALVVRYADQDDLPPGTTEPGVTPPAPPTDAWTVYRARAVLSRDNLAGKDEDAKKALRKSTFDALQASPYAPERLRLAELIVDLYEQPWARRALIEILLGAPLRWGTWKAFKTLYKRVEADHDAELFGVIAFRLDATSGWPSHVDHQEISARTVAYLRRRAWRYLRWLGQSVPELYAEMAAQVLRHYPRGARFGSPWIAAHIMGGKRFRYATSVWMSDFTLDERPFPDAWKRSPAPLLRLLEDAEYELVSGFAIRALRADFPDALRNVDAAWLRRVGRKGTAVSEELVVDVLEDVPAFHRSKLEGLGLTDLVVGLLASSSEKVSEYAKEYVKAHVPRIDPDRMLDLASRGPRAPALALLEARLADEAPRALGLPRLFRMLSLRGPIEALAKKKLEEAFTPDDFDQETFVSYYADPNDLYASFLDGFYQARETTIPTDYLVAVLGHPNCPYPRSRSIQVELRRRPGPEIGMAWFERALFDPRTKDLAATMLRGGALVHDELDVEWVKELTRRPTQRALALQLLGNGAIVRPASIGAPFLIGLLTRADPTLASFARQMLLSHFGPDDFEGGIDGIYRLAGPRNERGRKRPDAVRMFAFDWLRMHHPEIHAESAEARSLGVQPRAGEDAYTKARLAPFLVDPWAPARQLAVDIADKEMRRWDDPDLPYALAESAHVETRRLGISALLSLGKPDGGLPASWLRGERVFQMAESRVKATRELALTLIRQHYEQIGGKEKLAWLMDSPDREVRLFAVRLLWERHRPRGEGQVRFEAHGALVRFLRGVLFGLPPGRMERREGDAVDRPMRSGTAKRRLVELLRDMALDEIGRGDAELATLIAPLLSEVVHARALGEWQAAVTALATLRRARPELEIDLPRGSVEARAPRESRPLRGLA